MVEQPSPPPRAAETTPPDRGLGARAGGLFRMLAPVAAAAAIAAFGSHEQAPAAGAEGAYLGLLTAAVLGSAAALAPMPATELGLGAVLVTAAFWALPPGPLRGAGVTLLLAAAWVAAVSRRLATTGSRGGQAGALGFFVPLALGAQFLLRGKLLFLPEMHWRGLAALLVLPVVGGLALAALARRHGLGRALTATAAALVLAPGWTVTSTLALAALAAGSHLASRSQGSHLPAEPARGAGTRRAGVPAIPAALPTLAALAALAPLALLAALAPLAPLAPIAALCAPIAWQPRAGWVAAAAGLVLWRPPLPGWPRRHPHPRTHPRKLHQAILLALLALLAAAGLFLLAARFGAPFHLRPGSSLVLLALVVPAFLLPTRPHLALAALLLAVATPWVPDRSALAAPLALAALALPAAGPLAAPQRVWSAALAAGTALLAAYPWLRADPLAATLGLTGATPGPRLAVLVAGAVTTLIALTALAARTARSARTAPTALESRLAPAAPLAAFAARVTPAAAAAAAGGALCVALLLALPAPGVPLLAQVVPLDGAHPSWETDLPAPAGASAAAASGPVSTQAATLVVDSSLTHAAGLPFGAAVAVVSLRRADGASLAWTVRAGKDTGEWAARRPDVVASARLRSPAAWLSWVDDGFFAQLYRARWPLPAAGRFVHLRVELAARLPSDVGLALYQLELRP
jgi:hypothetical protein